MTETATFVCSICNEPSTDICVACTKDACRNHRCERCHRCSDCCDCEIPLTEALPVEPESEMAGGQNGAAAAEHFMSTGPEPVLDNLEIVSAEGMTAAILESDEAADEEEALQQDPTLDRERDEHGLE